MTNNLEHVFKGPPHGGVLYIEWDEKGALVYDYDGNAWPDAIREVVETVVADISEKRKWRSDEV